jgi:hypothetical protein
MIIFLANPRQRKSGFQISGKPEVARKTTFQTLCAVAAAKTIRFVFPKKTTTAFQDRYPVI